MKNKKWTFYALILLVLLAAEFLSFAALSPKPRDLSTIAEKSNWKRTGRLDETVELCHGFEEVYPLQVKCKEFGRTSESRPLVAMIVSLDGFLDPEKCRLSRRPVLFVQAGIHAGEIDGKDAGFSVVRDLLASANPTTGSAGKGPANKPKDHLSQVTLVFVPVFNADGLERFSRYNRPNQIGPEETGWRTTAQNLNLNRDYMKAESPEMAAMLNFLNLWDPILYVDLHVTDGADFQHDVALIVDPSIEGPEPMKGEGAALSRDIQRALEKKGHLPLSYYPSFIKEDDPASGVALEIGPPRFSHFYWGMRNRLGILVEAHSWKNYSKRVATMKDSLVTLLELTAKNGGAWMTASQKADLETSSIIGKRVPITYQHTAKFHSIDFLGYSYKRELSPVSGGLQTIYDSANPQIWKIPLYDELKPKILVAAPQGGYLVSSAYQSQVLEKLKLHGIKALLVQKELTVEETGTLGLESFRAAQVSFGKSSYEGRTRVSIEGRWTTESRFLTKGALFVPLDQPKARLILHLFEPGAPDSLVSWGYFNSSFETKEYMEPYVAELVAKDLLSKNDTIKNQFHRKLDSDPDFAKDPQKRLDFFYQNHPSWDERLNLYPVFRLKKSPGF